MDPDRYKRLVSDIQVLSQVEVEEIFKIIHESKCDYTRNNNGIFVNLAWLHHSTIEQIEKYVRFCNASKKELTKYESLCDVLNHKMHEYNEHASGSVGQAASLSTKQADEENEKMNTSKISSSMRYYLLKKRYSKQQGVSNTQLNCLVKEDYGQDESESERETDEAADE